MTFADSVYVARARKAQELLGGLGGLVFGPGAELAYVSGSWASTHERFSGLVIPAQGDPKYVAPAVDAGNMQVPFEVLSWADGEDPYALVRDVLGEVGAFGVGTDLSAQHLLALQEALGGVATLATPVLKELFMRKSPEEISQLRAAGHAIDSVFEQIQIIPGRTEAEVAAELHDLILAAGHSKVDFVIVGSGPNGANPHHSFSDRVIEPDDVVVVDIGGTWGDGYHSDCTRTFCLGKPPAYYEVVRQAQELAVQAVRPGVPAALIDAVARNHITEAGYGEFFIHRTGHGIGLSLHEEPFIVAGNDLVLEPGMAFSVEPGVYVPGEYGVRIEDIVVVTENGCERLNRSDTPKG